MLEMHGNDSHIQEMNIKFVKAYKTTPYVMIMNYVMDTEFESINTRNISRYIQQRRLTLNWLKQWTASSKKRQLWYLLCCILCVFYCLTSTKTYLLSYLLLTILPKTYPNTPLSINHTNRYIIQYSIIVCILIILVNIPGGY